MERDRNLLTSRQVETAKEGWHTDGGNLYLRVDDSPDGGRRKRWIVRVTRDGKKRDFGVGAAATTSLAVARKRRDEILDQLKNDIDPVAKKREARVKAKEEAAARRTFGEAAEAVFKNRSPGWKKGSTTPAAWVKSINKDCKSLLKRPVAEIGFAEVKSVVAPFWARNKLVAGRALLSRIEAVIEYAFAHEWRPEGDNPAAWKRFVHLFPARPNGGRKRPHPMLKWPDVPAFLTKLRGVVSPSLSAVALELIALTATRSNEVRGARWSEFDWDKKLWTIPPERMKRSIEFRVPLSEQALDLLKPLYDTKGRDQLLFPAAPRLGWAVRPGQPIANQTLWTTMVRVTGKTATTHGLRASFRTWCGDVGVEHEVSEACLAHGAGDAVVQAYNRAEMVERRRAVMQRWADFVSGTEPDAKVVAIGSQRKGGAKR
jgi:integrase